MEGQARNRTVELDRIVLEHVRTMLLALAALVDRSAALPTFERLHFLKRARRGIEFIEKLGE